MLSGPGDLLQFSFRSRFSISDTVNVISHRDCSPEWIDLSKIGNVVDQLQPLPRWAKKTVNFGPLTKQL